MKVTSILACLIAGILAGFVGMPSHAIAAGSAHAAVQKASYNIQINFKGPHGRRVRLVTVCASGTPAPISLIKTTTYIRSAKIDGKKTTIVPGHLNTGIYVTVTPWPAPAGKVQLAYSLSYTRLQAIHDFKSDGVTIQLPETSVRSVSGAVIMDLNSRDSITLPGAGKSGAATFTMRVTRG